MSSLVTSLPTITNTFVRASASRNGTSAATITRLAGKSTSTTLRHLGTGTAYATRTLTATRQPISTSLSKGNGGISLGTLVVVVIAGLLLLASGVAVWFLRLSYMRKRRAMTSSEAPSVSFTNANALIYETTERPSSPSLDARATPSLRLPPPVAQRPGRPAWTCSSSPPSPADDLMERGEAFPPPAYKETDN